MLDPARAAFRIADLSTLWLTVHAFERDAVRVRQRRRRRGSRSRRCRARTFTGASRWSGARCRPSRARSPFASTCAIAAAAAARACRRPRLPIGASRRADPRRAGRRRCSASATLVRVRAQGRRRVRDPRGRPRPRPRRRGRGPVGPRGRRDRRGRRRLPAEGRGGEGARRRRTTSTEAADDRPPHPRVVSRSPLLAIAAGRWPAPPSARCGCRTCGATCSPTSPRRSSTSSCRTPAMGAEELETGIAIPMEVGARGPARRAPHPLDVAARRRAGHGRVRARRRLLPLAPVRRRARRAGRGAAAAGHRPAAALEPDRPAERDLRVHARSGRRAPPT